MPSGFVQDQNQLQPNFYRVAIDMSGYSTSTDNTGGGITPNSADFFEPADMPTTLDYGKLRARGNMRFNNIVRRLSGLTDCQILDVTITESNGDTQATALAFTVKFERDAFIPLTGMMQGTSEVGDDIEGNTMTSVADAVKDAVVRGILDSTTANVRVYNGDDMSDNQFYITVEAPDSQSNVYNNVMVTLNSDTTVINS